jgi:hypothetical protein
MRHRRNNGEDHAIHSQEEKGVRSVTMLSVTFRAFTNLELFN